jgi:putative SOS response-associated peptidase YedK
MCGRFARYSDVQEFAGRFGVKAGFTLTPRYNIAPSQALLLARNAPEGGRQLVALTWGLVPAWSKEPRTSYSTFNARAETVAEKPAFRAAFRQRRCLIAADGYYEWKQEGTGKQPYFIRLKSRAPFAFAGLWEEWAPRAGQEAERLATCTIIVTAANDLTRPIHDRMPVIVPPTLYDAWMDPALRDPARLLPMLQPYPAEFMEAYPVSTRVGNVRNEGAGLIERV